MCELKSSCICGKHNADVTFTYPKKDKRLGEFSQIFNQPQNNSGDILIANKASLKTYLAMIMEEAYIDGIEKGEENKKESNDINIDTRCTCMQCDKSLPCPKHGWNKI